ncbi:MAG: hypothetical protein WEC75_01210 [Dehalococcoidia bacterium]
MNLRLLAVLALTLALAPACRDSGVDIPDSYATSNQSYTLLYSTLGYDSAGTKRLLIRQNDPSKEVSEALAFRWRVIDAKGKQAGAGQARYGGRVWNIPVWVADFSAVKAPGTYRIMVEAPEAALATQPFRIDRFLLFRSTFSAVALENAEARAAPVELDNGYYDGHAIAGSAGMHADFAVGLIEAYARRGGSLDDADRLRLLAAIERAVDYLVLVSDPGSGEVRASSPTRPFGGEGPLETLATLRALARYASVFQQENPAGATRAFRRAVQGQEWLLQNAPGDYTPAWRATVNYDLYRFSGGEGYLGAGLQAVRDEAAAYDLRTMERFGEDPLPHFEGMYRMWRELPEHPDRAFWEQTAEGAAQQYREVLLLNAFHVVPSGISEPGKASSSEQWDQMQTISPPGQGEAGIVGNAWFVARSIDAVFLADMTKDPVIEQVAAAALGWIGGLNPGIPVERIAGPRTGSPVEAASFLTGAGVRSAQDWSGWEWGRPKPFATVMRGFWGGFFFDDSFFPAESSIRDDGLWLYAVTAYEDYLNPGVRAPEPEAPAPPAGGAHIATTEAAESDGVLRLTVHVADASGAPVSGAKVTAAWTGVPRADASAEDLVTTAQCLTDAGGSCLVVQAADALRVSRPVTVTVTHIEHPELQYDLASDVPERTRAFP